MFLCLLQQAPRAAGRPVRQRAVYRPAPVPRFRQLTHCYQLPMGLDYKVTPLPTRHYTPSPHQPTYRQRALRPVQAVPYRPYRSRQYRLMPNNYGYAMTYVPRAGTPASLPPLTRRESRAADTGVKAEEEVKGKERPMPVGGVAVLPPVLGASPAAVKRAVSTSAVPAVAAHQDHDGPWSARYYRYHHRTIRYDPHPRYREYRAPPPLPYREYRAPPPLPYREYDHLLVYRAGPPPGHRIHRTQQERRHVARAPLGHTATAAPAPLVAPVVLPAPPAAAAAAAPPVEKEEEEEEGEEEEAEQEEGEQEEEQTPQPAPDPQPEVVAAAALVPDPGQPEQEEVGPSSPQLQPSTSPQPQQQPQPQTAPSSPEAGMAAVVPAAASAPAPSPPSPAEPSAVSGNHDDHPDVAVPVAAAVVAGAAAGAAVATVNSNSTATTTDTSTAENTTSNTTTADNDDSSKETAAVAAAATVAAAASVAAAAQPPAPEANTELSGKDCLLHGCLTYTFLMK